MIIYDNPENQCFFRGWKMFNPPIGWYSGYDFGSQEPGVCETDQTANALKLVNHIPRMVNDTGCYPSYDYWDEGKEDMVQHIKDIQTEFDNHPFDDSKTLPENAVILNNVTFDGLKNKSMSLTAMYSIYIWSQSQFKR